MKKLIFSIHDVTPRHFDRLQRIDEMLAKSTIGTAYAMLVVPNFWKEWPIEGHLRFQHWLRAKADAGVEMILHGFYHLDDTLPQGISGSLKAKWLTRNEGEFLSLDDVSARQRIVDGKMRLEQILGRDVNAFVAPAWLYSDATKDVLAQLAFTRAESHMRVWSPVDGTQLSFSPVISYASRTRARVASSIVWSRLASIGLYPFDVARLALHPHDLDVNILQHEFSRVLHHWLTYRQPTRYRELCAP